jgi:hypothetical protein
MFINMAVNLAATQQQLLSLFSRPYFKENFFLWLWLQGVRVPALQITYYCVQQRVLSLNTEASASTR